MFSGTGLDPKQTGFFQALKIQTKIVKGAVEIVNPVVVINEDDKINSLLNTYLLYEIKRC